MASRGKDGRASDGRGYVGPLISATRQHTVPYVYVRGAFLGGFDALDEIDRLGQLEEMVKSADERGASNNTSRTRIVVAPRAGDR